MRNHMGLPVLLLVLLSARWKRIKKVPISMQQCELSKGEISPFVLGPLYGASHRPHASSVFACALPVHPTCCKYSKTINHFISAEYSPEIHRSSPSLRGHGYHDSFSSFHHPHKDRSLVQVWNWKRRISMSPYLNCYEIHSIFEVHWCPIFSVSLM